MNYAGDYYYYISIQTYFHPISPPRFSCSAKYPASARSPADRETHIDTIQAPFNNITSPFPSTDTKPHNRTRRSVRHSHCNGGGNAFPHPSHCRRWHEIDDNCPHTFPLGRAEAALMKATITSSNNRIASNIARSVSHSDKCSRCDESMCLCIIGRMYQNPGVQCNATLVDQIAATAGRKWLASCSWTTTTDVSLSHTVRASRAR